MNKPINPSTLNEIRQRAATEFLNPKHSNGNASNLEELRHLTQDKVLETETDLEREIGERIVPSFWHTLEKAKARNESKLANTKLPEFLIRSGYRPETSKLSRHKSKLNEDEITKFEDISGYEVLTGAEFIQKVKEAEGSDFPAKFNKIYLANANLSEIKDKLKGIIITNSQLVNCYFGEKPDFTDANLSGTSFEGRPISKQVKNNGHLEFITEAGGSFDLSGAIFNGASLESTNFYNVNLEKAEFGKSEDRPANLSNSFWLNVNAKKIQAEGTIAREMKIGQNSDLSSSKWDDADLSFSDLEGLRAPSAEFNHTKLIAANLNHAYMPFSKIIYSDLRAIEGERIDLEGSEFTGSDFSTAILPKANLSLSKAVKALNQPVSVKFSEANLTGAYLVEASLSDADFRASNFEQVVARGVDLSRALFNGAQVNADFSPSGDLIIPQDETVLDKDFFPESPKLQYDPSELNIEFKPIKLMNKKREDLGHEFKGKRSNLQGTDFRFDPFDTSFSELGEEKVLERTYIYDSNFAFVNAMRSNWDASHIQNVTFPFANLRHASLGKISDTETAMISSGALELVNWDEEDEVIEKAYRDYENVLLQLEEVEAVRQDFATKRRMMAEQSKSQDDMTIAIFAYDQLAKAKGEIEKLLSQMNALNSERLERLKRLKDKKIKVGTTIQDCYFNNLSEIEARIKERIKEETGESDLTYKNYKYLKRVFMLPASLRFASLRGCYLQGCDFTRAGLGDVNAKHAEFERCQLPYSDLVNFNGTESIYSFVNFDGARAKNTDLSYSTMTANLFHDPDPEEYSRIGTSKNTRSKIIKETWLNKKDSESKTLLHHLYDPNNENRIRYSYNPSLKSVDKSFKQKDLGYKKEDIYKFEGINDLSRKSYMNAVVERKPHLTDYHKKLVAKLNAVKS